MANMEHCVVIPCEASIMRGQLKHSWLENQLANKTADDIVVLWRGRGWAAVEVEFPCRVNEVRKLVGDMEAGFSPSQLVDRLAGLSALSDDLKKAIKGAVHAVYLERSSIAGLKQRLEDAVSEVSDSLDLFRGAWAQPSSEAAEQDVRVSWGELYRCAVRLRDELDRLPRGVVLP